MKHTHNSEAFQENRLIYLEAGAQPPEAQPETPDTPPETPQDLEQAAKERVKDAEQKTADEAARVEKTDSDAAASGGTPDKPKKGLLTAIMERISSKAHEKRMDSPVGSKEHDQATQARDAAEAAGRVLGKIDEAFASAQKQEAPATETKTAEETPAEPVSTPEDAPPAPAAPTEEAPVEPVSTPEDAPPAPVEETPAEPAAPTEETPAEPVSTPEDAPPAPTEETPAEPATPAETPAEEGAEEGTEEGAETDGEEGAEGEIDTAKAEGEEAADAVKDQTEKVEEAEPKTKGEKLEKGMKEALNKLRDAKDITEAFTALMKLVTTAMEYIRAAKDGSASNPLEQKPTQDEPAKGEAKGDAKSTEAPKTETPEDATRKKILEELKPKADDKETGKDAPKDLAENLDQLKEKKSQEITRNEAEIAETNTSIESIKQENNALIDKKAGIEKQINELNGQPDSESKISRLNMDLKRVNAQIDANNTAIDEMTKHRDDLTAKNEELKKEIEVIDKMKADTATAEGKVKDLLEEARRILEGKEKEKGVEKPANNVKIEIKPDGSVVVTIEGAKPDMQKILNVTPDANGNVELNEKQVDEAAQTTENTEK